MKKLFTLLLLALSLSAFSTSVTFEVSMKGSGWTYDSVFVVGDMSEWGFVQLQDQGDSLFSVTMNIPENDTIVFYYITVGYWASDYLDYRETVPVDCDGSAELYGWDGDRAFIVTGTAAKYSFYWSTCDEVVTPGTAIINRENMHETAGLYPNPSKGIVSVLLQEPNRGATLDLIDISGKTIRRVELTSMETRIDVSDLAKGIYLAKITNGTGTLLKKLIVQ